MAKSTNILSPVNIDLDNLVFNIDSINNIGQLQTNQSDWVFSSLDDSEYNQECYSILSKLYPYSTVAVSLYNNGNIVLFANENDNLELNEQQTNVILEYWLDTNPEVTSFELVLLNEESLYGDIHWDMYSLIYSNNRLNVEGLTHYPITTECKWSQWNLFIKPQDLLNWTKCKDDNEFEWLHSLCLRLIKDDSIIFLNH